MGRKQLNQDKPNIALLLTGGGARAAYQVGVLKALAHSMARTAPIPFQIINGTSAGAINSSALACYASCMHLAIRKIEWVWKNFHTSMVYRSDFIGVYGNIFANMLRSFQSQHLNHPPASLLDNAPLRRLLSEVLDLSRIDRNIHRNFLDAVSITASCYSTGESVAFYQAKDAQPWKRARRSGQNMPLTIDHLMASSAIPLVFPSVRVKHHYYGDGSIHQLSPLSPSIHLGADKIFIVGVDQPEPETPVGFERHFPGMSAVAGHLLDSIFSDTLQSDLERMERINRTVDAVKAKNQHTELKRIDTFLVNPSANFDQIAQELYDDMPLAIRSMLRLIGVKKTTESSLPSYLMFEKAFTQRLIEIGYQDGLKQLPEIRSFLELD
ncbi:Patatin [Pseudoalteromonas luteoviolacea B = ATCC 29581]|nr:Patatin [Pseudoalteromonas luteoviolacea B = ATCC 29581]